jgi:hypothetical protein
MTYIGFDHHKKWTQSAGVDDQGEIIREMRVLNDSSSLKGFLKGLAKPWKGGSRSGAHVGLDLRHAERAWSEGDRR